MNQGSQSTDPASVSTRIPAWPIDVARMIEEARWRRWRPVWQGTAGGAGDRRDSGDGRVGVLLAGPGHVLGPLRAVPVAQLVASRRIGVPAGGCGRGRRLRSSTRIGGLG